MHLTSTTTTLLVFHKNITNTKLLVVLVYGNVFVYKYQIQLANPVAANNTTTTTAAASYGNSVQSPNQVTR